MAFMAGALIPLMAILNGGLAHKVGGAIQATLLLFAIGLLALLIVAAAAKAQLPAVQILAHIRLFSTRAERSSILYLEHHLPCTKIRCRQRDSIRCDGAAAYVRTHRSFCIGWRHVATLTATRTVGLAIVIAGVVVTQIGDRIVGGAR